MSSQYHSNNRKSRRQHQHRTIVASLAPDYFSSKQEHQEPSSKPSSSSMMYSYVPPYGMVPRKGSIVLSMMVNDYQYDDRFRKKMNSKRIKDPVVQDFGSMNDWQASKTGLGRMGDDKIGDDRVSEQQQQQRGRGMGGGMFDERDEMMMMDMDGPGPGPGPMGYDDMMMERQQQQRRRPPPPPPGFEGDGGNFWVNPPGNMDEFPAPVRYNNENEGMMSRPRGRRGGGSRRGGRNNRQRRRSRDMEEDDEDWWETRPRGEDDYDDELFDDFDGYGGEYGVPPPTRSRSSFRSGALPPPRPVKQFYDKLFWFGFDPDVTQPTDRTMFGGTRGKFNAMDMLADREERQRMRMLGPNGPGGGGGRMRRGGGRGGRGGGRRTGNNPVIQDFGDLNDWNARKQGGGRTGGDAVGDDQHRPNYGYDYVGGGGGVGGPAPFPGDMPPPPPPPGMPEYDFEAGYNEDFLMDDVDFESRRSSRGRGRGRRGMDSRRRSMDRRAEEYDMFLSGGGGVDEYLDDEYIPPMTGGRSSRRRKGFAYKYDDLFEDDGEYIDVEPKYASDQELLAARGVPLESSRGRSRRRRSRSWEDRAIEMDRVPPRGAVAWGPDGPLEGGENPLDMAAMDALRDIKKSKRYLERKESDVEDAKDEVVNLKADATYCENKLEDSRGREASKLEQELGYILRDVEDASRNLRLVRAERDAASERVSDLEERNWALLSEYEAARSFENGV